MEIHLQCLVHNYILRMYGNGIFLKTDLWFTHRNIQDILVWIVVVSRLAILSLGVLLSYVSSVAVTCFWKKCNRNRKNGEC